MNEEEAFQRYYASFFPCDAVFGLLTRHCKAEHREVGVETLDGKFTRWRACATSEQLKSMVSKHGVGKLNVGAAYEQPVSMRYKLPVGEGMRVRGREMSFDIDMQDYSFFNIDKQDTDSNDLHFRVVGMGIDLLETLLTDVFGFASFLKVYSGRRGAHLHVLDERAFNLSDEARRGIAGFLTPPRKVWKPSGRQAFRYLFAHPCFDPTYSRFGKQLIDGFEVLCKSSAEKGIGLLATPMTRQRFLNMLELDYWMTGFQKRLILARDVSGQDALKMIKNVILRIPDENEEETSKEAGEEAKEEKEKKKKQPTPRDYAYMKFYECMYTILFPRIDVAVTQSCGHMLKCVYSMHPNTGRISTPVFGKKMSEFNPKKDAHNVSSLVGEGASEEARAAFRRNVDAFREALEGAAVHVPETIQAREAKRRKTESGGQNPQA